jgi:hypothetical protein
VLRRESTVTQQRGVQDGQTARLVRSFLTSLGAQIPARQLLRRIREQRSIEHRRHDVHAVPWSEEASHVRACAAPEVLAALHKAVLGRLRHHGQATLAAALRHFAWSLGVALRLLGLHPI